ncbi:hypothetical protein Glove_481g108 [Diversispora epigaea]|uniref:Uncharacterized protein n=1 Tax=Diversispora epigaea TaxID=1348612 RepID=A0A397GM08_9GLOM|nr:hypothetical protein Glove_481g108 [Diversispora epigaea]
MEPHLINENTLEENVSLYFSDYSAGSEDKEAETFEESDEESDIFGELPEIELFKFNEENYINAQIALENEIVNQLSDENEDFEDQEILSVPSPSPLSSTTPVEEVNELSYILDPTIYKNFSPCVLIDYFNNKLQTCGQTTNVRNICQLVGTWQIDENAILNYQSKGIPLGVCMNHFNYDQKNYNAYCKQLRKPEQSEIRRRRCLFCFQNFHFFSRGLGCKNHLWNIWGKNIQIPCIGLYTCDAIHKYQDISKIVFDDASTVRYICNNCYESYGGHINRRTGSGKQKFDCKRELHKNDVSKSLELIIQWLKYVVNTKSEEEKEIILASILVPILNLLFTSFETPLKYEYYNPKNNTRYSNDSNNSPLFLITILSELPSYFFLKSLFSINLKLLLNEIDINPKLEWTDEKWKEIGTKLGNELWNSHKMVTENKSELQLPISLRTYHASFPKFLTGFFDGLISEIFQKKLIILNKKRKQHNKPLKQLDNEHITKCVTFIISLIVGMTFPNLGVWFTQIMASISRKPRLISSFRRLLSTLHISGHTDGHECRIEKQRMTKIDPTERLLKGLNIWNLAVIDNIDFKEKTFTYGNIFDATRGSSHTTLRMVFQMQMPISLDEKASDEKRITSPLGLFGMNDQIKNVWDMFDKVIDDLLNFQSNSENQVTFNTNFDMTTIHEKILENIDQGCSAGAPNIVILETGGIPNSNEGIFRSTEMYKEDFKLRPHDYLDVVADEAIFRRLIKQREQWPNLRPILGQWHTSKDMCGVLIVLFSSYRIFDLAKALGVKFLDKLDKVVDYRSTVRVLELIWCAVIIAIRIYMKKTNLNKYNIMNADSGANSVLRIWYFYYKWASIFKAHRIGIRVGCSAGAPNIVILETGGIPNSNEGIFRSTEMYKEDFKLRPHDYLDVVADEAIFRRLIKQREQWPNLRPILGQWHTSKDMCGVLIVLFSSYRIFDLAKALGVKFLDKLDKVVDYRSTVRVLELIWCAVIIAIRIYMKKTNLNKYNIMNADSGANSVLRIWYFYYKWASIFKAHRIGIRVGNYKLQKNALACFAGLFPSAGKSNYSTSVAQYLGILAQYPKLEEKLECASSVKIDDDEKRKYHYFAFDEALETFGVKFVKKNIIGNVIDVNNLKLQVKAVQSEHDRIGILLSEYLDDPCGSIGQRAVNTRKSVMWNLIHELLSAFSHSDDYNRYRNSLWDTTSPDQFTAASIAHLENCFPGGTLRIEAIFLQDVISVQKSNKVGRRKLKITRWRPNDQKSKRKKAISTVAPTSHLNTENSSQVISDQQILNNSNIVNQNKPPRKKQRQARRETKPEEKKVLESLITCSKYPTDD